MRACAAGSCGNPQILLALGTRFYQEVVRCERDLVCLPVQELGLAVVHAALQALAAGLRGPGIPPAAPARAVGRWGPTSSAHPWPESLRLVPD